MPEKKLSTTDIVKSLGLVFGDIGTSPIYTITVVFILLSVTPDNILGVLSLIIWTMVSLVTIQYSWLAMSLSKRGEGGSIVLKEILQSFITSKKAFGLVTLVSVVAISLLIGDGVITPAISILSAVEGAVLIPGLENLSITEIVMTAMIISGLLFVFQKKGTDRVAGAFGPITGVWFLALAFFGIVSIAETPQVIKAINPYYGIKFLADNGFRGFISLGEIILCATGGEALYADMGHLGSRPIRQAWVVVFIALVLNYLGQGAFLMQHPLSRNILFEMVFHYSKTVYVPFLLLSIAATIIASQAMISGMFSIVYQGITTRLMPMFKVDYTSVERKSQIYIASVNWFLLIAVLFIMIVFEQSHRLAAAYGLAVTGTMTLTGILMTFIFYKKKRKLLVFASVLITFIDIAYLVSNFYKIPHGGYWSLIIASMPFGIIILYIEGQKRLYRMMDFMRLEDFVHKFKRVYATAERIKGTALFLIKDVEEIPFYVTQTMFFHAILYRESIFLSIIKRDDPFGVIGFFKEDIAEGLRVFEIQMGYMEVIDVEEIMREAKIEERVVFYGIEDIITRNIIWRTFSLIKKITPTFIKFYKFPPKKLHGVITEVRL
jgi:KUP system potassium uptake protein